ncbi:MAG: thiamine pyrophosphate-dependent dehydrogenase E1 component subunit alpha, partial [Bdellovibrionales bacterium]|nr:thiamine pyrophosphate-dependent dehydrogenase E1 component subunit alpha [Oligoflexia bacterium]
GTAEGEFASCLVWASRPPMELPILIIVTNNEFGISTPFSTQHGETKIADRAAAFNIKNKVINGNDPEESYFAIQEAMEYVRNERRPYFIEAKVSRLYGHSSASGGNFQPNEKDCLEMFEARLEKEGVMTKAQMTELREKYNATMMEQSKQAKQEQMPDGSTIYDHTYYGQKGRYW